MSIKPILTTTLLYILCSTSFASSPSQANPKHVELFNTRNFCVVCTLNGAELSPDTLYDGVHYNANLSASYVYGTTMDRLDLTFAFLYAIKGEYFTIKNSKVRLINITYSDLPYFTFTNNEGNLVNFTGSGLNYGNFQGAQLDDVIFTQTSLVETDLSNTNFKRALFNGALIYDSNFTNAELTYADFTNASLKNVNFTRANLLGAKISKEQLAQANVCEAVMPDGTRGNC